MLTLADVVAANKALDAQPAPDANGHLVYPPKARQEMPTNRHERRHALAMAQKIAKLERKLGIPPEASNERPDKPAAVR